MMNKTHITMALSVMNDSQKRMLAVLCAKRSINRARKPNSLAESAVRKAEQFSYGKMTYGELELGFICGRLDLEYRIAHSDYKNHLRDHCYVTPFDPTPYSYCERNYQNPTFQKTGFKHFDDLRSNLSHLLVARAATFKDVNDAVDCALTEAYEEAERYDNGYVEIQRQKEDIDLIMNGNV